MPAKHNNQIKKEALRAPIIQGVRRHVNWDALGAVAETIGAMATILMLWYLSRQIGQNTHATKFASFQTANSEITQLLQMEPEYARTLLMELNDLNEQELGYATNRLTGFFNIL